MIQANNNRLEIEGADLETFKTLVKEIAEEYNSLWHGADIHLNIMQLSLIRTLIATLNIAPHEGELL